jgi:hypothetical protein
MRLKNILELRNDTTYSIPLVFCAMAAHRRQSQLHARNGATMNTKPEALRLADALDDEEFMMQVSDIFKAAAELRRLHEVNQMLIEALDIIVMACESPREMCEIEQSLPQAKTALEIAKR